MKKRLSLLISVIIVISAVFAVPYSVSAAENGAVRNNNNCGDFVYAVLSDGTAQITKYTGSQSVLEIPPKLDLHPVTSIGREAFYTCDSLESITIPDSVSDIGEWSFAWCRNLESVTIPSSVETVSNGAFFSCLSLESVTIPSSVTSIGHSAFGGCSKLETIDILSSVVSIGGYAFSETPWLEAQPDGCVYINNQLYCYKGEAPYGTKVKLKEGTTGVCGGAFANTTGITKVVLPSSVTSIGEEAFLSCDVSMVLIYNPECILGNYCISYGTSIHGYEGSTAEEYAQRFSLDFVLLEDKTDDHPDEFILGDVDADMQVSVIDATAIQLHLALIRSLPTKALSCADTDKDGEVSVLDATQIQLFIAQLIPSL